MTDPIRPPETIVGTTAHAEHITAGRHPGVQTALAWLCFSHLPEHLQSVSEPFYVAAWILTERVTVDSAELTAALNKLVEAKDWMMRAGIRSDEGRPGPIPRPATVVDPPAAAPMEYVTDTAGDPYKEWRDTDLRPTVGPDVQRRPIRDNPQA